MSVTLNRIKLDLTGFLSGDIVTPLMILLAFLTLIILVLLARTSSPRKSGSDDADKPPVVDEIEPEVLPPQEIIEPEKHPIVEEVLPPREIIEPEIRPIVEEGESVADFQPPPNEAEIKDDIRPLLQKGASDGCQYCSIFRDIGTAVCPNCGRPLNLKIIQKES